MKHLLLMFTALLLTTSCTKKSDGPKKSEINMVTKRMSSEPSTLNPFTSTDGYSQTIHSYVLDGLGTINKNTWEWEHNLAESWSISDDKKTYTFKLREGLKFSDGKPLTAEDVKFTFDAMKDIKYKAVHIKGYLEGIKSAEVVDPLTIKFIAKENLWANFDNLAGGIITVLPKHIYKDPNVKMNKTVVGSGPYMIDKYDKGKSIILKKNPLWWGWAEAKKKGKYNFDKIRYRFINDEAVALEMFKKGELDFLGLTGEQYIKQTDGDLWKNNLVKVKTNNSAPKGYAYIGWNLRKPLFKDKRVRKALTHLMNRKLMVEKFRFNLARVMSGPIYPQSPYAPKDAKPLDFDPKKSLTLLSDAGWSDSDKNGVLDKKVNGKKVEFKFTLLLPSKFWEKYVTILKEDAKKVGVDMEIKLVEWSTFLKLKDGGQFDAVIMAWGMNDVHWDPHQIWHSENTKKGGSNYIHYKNKDVDKWIEEARRTWDQEKRIKILHKVFYQIADDAPYIFLFVPDAVLYAHSKNIEKPKETLKYSVGFDYWKFKN